VAGRVDDERSGWSSDQLMVSSLIKKRRGREARRGDYIDVSGWVTDRFTGARKIFLFFFVIKVARLFLTSNVHNRTHNMSIGQVVDIISLYEE